MSKTKLVLICGTIALLCGCTSPRVILAWKNQRLPENYDRILVAAVVKSPADGLRREIEKDFTQDLMSLGYNAVSRFDEFGQNGLSKLGQEETYIKLCNKGIDAVIIITLIDESKEKQQKIRKSYGYPNKYYYTRIWNYKNIQADLALKDSGNTSYFWEAILFNLRTLETECTIQTKHFKNFKEEKMAREFEKRVISEMVKQKVLTRKQPISTLKAF
jgi:hypothetical protein